MIKEIIAFAQCKWALRFPGIPIGLEDLEKLEGIFQLGKNRGILDRLEKSGKNQGKSHRILECYLLFFSDI